MCCDADVLCGVFMCARVSFEPKSRSGCCSVAASDLERNGKNKSKMPFGTFDAGSCDSLGHNFLMDLLDQTLRTPVRMQTNH